MATKRVLTPSKSENGSPLTPAAGNSPQSKKYKQKLELPASNDLENIDWGDDDDFALALGAMESVSSHRLDLGQWQRCEVELVEKMAKSQDLRLQVKRLSGGEPDTAECLLQAPWNHMRVQAGDTVSLLAKWQPSLGSYVVDKEQGYCVSHPDLLISGTTVTGSLFCRRKAVLQERFRGLDSGSSIVGSSKNNLIQNNGIHNPLFRW